MGNWFKSKVVLTDDETKVREIISAMLASEDTLIEVNPDDMSYMLSDEKHQYFVDVDSVGVIITNHTFYLDARLTSGKIDLYKTMIKEETVRRRTIKKERIFKNRLGLLDNIITKLYEE